MSVSAASVTHLKRIPSTVSTDTNSPKHITPPFPLFVASLLHFSLHPPTYPCILNVSAGYNSLKVKHLPQSSFLQIRAVGLKFSLRWLRVALQNDTWNFLFLQIT